MYGRLVLPKTDRWMAIMQEITRYIQSATATPGPYHMLSMNMVLMAGWLVLKLVVMRDGDRERRAKKYC